MTNRSPDQPCLAITSGDPCGIGPEVILKALARPVPPRVRLLVIGDLAVFAHTARTLHVRLPRWAVRPVHAVSPGPSAPQVTFIDLAHPGRFKLGTTSEQAGSAALAYLDAAIQLWRQDVADALVTAPVTKWAIERARNGFQGQTEYLAQACGVSSVVMLFVSRHLRVALLTRHVALREVPSHVTKPAFRRAALTTVEGLKRYFGIPHPRLAVCGLNPHAGEGGLFGDEERRVLLPVLREFRQDGIRLEGPFAADSFFVDPRGYDAVLCWYHDQALIPFKRMARDVGCQLSLGLPVVRTSPDHGSALDIAGKGCAHPGSMRYAIRVAADLAGRTPRDAHQAPAT